MVDYTVEYLRAIYLNKIKGRHIHDLLTKNVIRFKRVHILETS